MPTTVPTYTVHGSHEEEPPNPEDCLYHYTTAEGLQGILKTKKLRATLYTMLNDPDELIRGRDIIRAELPSNEDEFMHIGKAWSDFDRDHYFITSLTEHADDIDMWRSYGGGGFNIIFSRDRLEESVRGSSLLKVVYTEEGRCQLVGASAAARSSANFSAGVAQPRVCRDLSLSSVATASR